MIKAFKKVLYNQYMCLQLFFDTPKKYLHVSTKSPLARFIEVEIHLMRQGEFCDMYYAWGLNTRGSSIGDYLTRKDFLRYKRKAEDGIKQYMQLNGLDYDVITKDKFITAIFCKAVNIKCVENLAIFVNGVFTSINSLHTEFESLMHDEETLFVKNVCLEASDGVLYCQADESGIILDGIAVSHRAFGQKVRNGVWVVQPVVEPHERIRTINDSALNTIRIMTIIEDGRPSFLGGFASFARNGEKTDAWSKGSIAVGFDLERECLKEHGYVNLSDTRYSVLTRHPDSGMLFDGYHIPYLRAAVEACLKGHEWFYSSFVLGWDVAITPGGPVVIEVNERPGMNVVQCVVGGLKKRMEKCYKSLIRM